MTCVDDWSPRRPEPTWAGQTWSAACRLTASTNRAIVYLQGILIFGVAGA